QRQAHDGRPSRMDRQGFRPGSPTPAAARRASEQAITRLAGTLSSARPRRVEVGPHAATGGAAMRFDPNLERYRYTEFGPLRAISNRPPNSPPKPILGIIHPDHADRRCGAAAAPRSAY